MNARVTSDLQGFYGQVVARSTWLDFNTLGYGMVALFVLAWSGPPSAASSRKYRSKAAGRDDLEDPARLITGVPTRVPLVAPLEDELARTGLDDIVRRAARAHASLEDEAVLVLARA